MTVATLCALFLKRLGLAGVDVEEPDNLDDFRPEALAYLNEGYMKAILRLRPRATDRVTLQGGGTQPAYFLRSDLRFTCVRVRAWYAGGTRRRAYGGQEGRTERIAVPFLKAGDQVEVEYEAIPPPLEKDTDIPWGLPEPVQTLLADYAAARVLEGEDKLQAASALYAAYERGLAQLCPLAGRFHNAFTAWRDL